MMELKGNPDADTFVESYVNLEKLAKGDPKTLVRLPKGADDVEGLAEFRTKMGIPPTPEGYKLPDALKDQDWAKALVPIAHKHNMSDSQLAGFLTEARATMDGLGTKAQETLEAAAKVEHGKRMQALVTEHGEKLPGYLEETRRAVRVLVPEKYKDPGTGAEIGRDDIMGAIEAAIGVELTANIFHTAGKFQSEDQLIKGSPTDGIISPQAAQARMTALINDREWGKRLMANPTGPEAAEKLRLDMILAAQRQAA